MNAPGQRPTHLGGLPLALVLAALLAGLGAAAQAQEPLVVEVEMGDFYFSPSRIVVVAGGEVTLRIINVGTYPHTLTIEGLDVDVAVAPGETAEVTFTVAEPGEYRVYCRYHPRMTGVLEARSPAPATVTVVETLVETTTVTTTVERTVTPPPRTVTQTITQQAPPTTLTVTETVTAPPQTLTLTETQTVTLTLTQPPAEGGLGAGAAASALGALVAGIVIGHLVSRARR